MARSLLWLFAALLVALATIPSASAVASKSIDGCLSVGDNECGNGGGIIDVCWHFDGEVIDADAQVGPGIGFKVWVPFVGFDEPGLLGTGVTYGTQEMGYHPEC